MSQPLPITLWCLHGAVGMAEDWQAFADHMTPHGYHVQAVDLWQYMEAGSRSLEATADSLCAEVRQHQGTNILVGYSLGGRIALHALLKNFPPWRAAIIVSSHPGLVDDAERSIRLQIDTDWSVKCLHDDWNDFLIAWQAQPILRSSAPVSAGMGDRATLQPRREAIACSFIDWSLGRQQNLLTELPKIDVPVLWLSGQSDEKFTALAALGSSAIPHAAWEVVADCGHRIPWEQPVVFANTVHRFITGVLADKKS